MGPGRVDRGHFIPTKGVTLIKEKASHQHEFNTPPDLLQRIRQLSPDRRIDLDPCGNAFGHVRAVTTWTGAPGVPEDDGLHQSWRGRGLVFMNPPHSMSPHHIEPWMKKVYDEFINTPAWVGEDQVVGLIPAKTDTAWFHDQAVHFPGRVFLRGRLTFWSHGVPLPGPGKFASMLIYAGYQPDHFIHLFAKKGWAPHVTRT